MKVLKKRGGSKKGTVGALLLQQTLASHTQGLEREGGRKKGTAGVILLQQTLAPHTQNLEKPQQKRRNPCWRG